MNLFHPNVEWQGLKGWASEILARWNISVWQLMGHINGLAPVGLIVENWSSTGISTQDSCNWSSKATKASQNILKEYDHKDMTNQEWSNTKITLWNIFKLFKILNDNSCWQEKTSMHCSSWSIDSLHGKSFSDWIYAEICFVWCNYIFLLKEWLYTQELFLSFFVNFH